MNGQVRGGIGSPYASPIAINMEAPLLMKKPLISMLASLQDLSKSNLFLFSTKITVVFLLMLNNVYPCCMSLVGMSALIIKHSVSVPIMC